MSTFWQWAVTLMMTSLCACSTAAIEPEARQCMENAQQNFSQALACYRTAESSAPLSYKKIEVIQLHDIEKRSYELTSQFWSPDQLVAPGKWVHMVDVYIPSNALAERALLVINNGTYYGSDKSPAQTPTDFSEQILHTIATHTRTIVVSVSNVPNQSLTYQDDAAPKREDENVARSWKLFLDAPEQRPFMPVQIPMMNAIVKAMDLAEKELEPWKINSFIATGLSKRGRTAWHTALVDTRIAALVPFVSDELNFNSMLEHTYQVYGKNWPIAFGPYYQEGIAQQRKTANFEKLMAILDPLRYLDSAYASRLAIPKYIVNASGDDFFVPDNARLYLDKLPGTTALRIAPNSDHFGIKKYTEETLITFVNRLQQSNSLPTLTSNFKQEATSATLSVQFSETPLQVKQWIADNPNARDFRYACGIQYVQTPLELDANQSVEVSFKTSATGWQALFIEAHFKDGFVATTPVYVFPDVYPVSAPPSKERSPCNTLPGK